ncbi:MAG: hypothetical protein GY862_10810 [Gammaproteobacteria bacterium]|nr:hypothetical protein [Gammaproteobacteria bacterium]
MKVIIEASVFTDPQIAQTDLHALFNMGCKRRHWLQTESVQEVKNWLQRQEPKLQAEYELALEDGIDQDVLHPAVHTLRISCRESAEERQDEMTLPLAEAITFLHRPLKILVEDNINDKNFMLAAATGENKQKLHECLEKEWIEFEHGGGMGSIQSRVKIIRSDKQMLMSTWVLFDSDALCPGNPSEQSERLRRLCGNEVEHHQLQRRAMENYLPVPLLEKWAGGDWEKRRKIKVFKRLTEPQRFHFNMKGGFKADQDRDDAERAGNLYEGTGKKDRTTLHTGFGGNIGELFGKIGKLLDLFGISEESWFQEDKHLREEIDPMLNRLFSLI